jgi:nucleoside-diphosphate-sugar epimerase
MMKMKRYMFMVHSPLNKHILITGGAGFIGSHIAEECLRQGANVTIIDNEFNGNPGNLKSFKTKALTYVKGDIRDAELLAKLMKGVDYVFHEAAVASVPRSIDNPYNSLDNNIMGTLNVLLKARDAKVKRVLFASSSSVYGDDTTMPKLEEKTGKTLSPYALSKHTCEELMRQFYELYGLETVTLRYFNVFGEKQDPNSQYSAVIPKFITMMLNGKQPTIFGTGEVSRDFTFVKNVVDANLLFMKLPKAKVCGKVFNIACGGSISLNELVSLLNENLSTNLKPIYSAGKIGEIKDSKANISKAIALGYKPKINFNEGLKRTIKYYKEEEKRCK